MIYSRKESISQLATFVDSFGQLGTRGEFTWYTDLKTSLYSDAYQAIPEFTRPKS